MFQFIFGLLALTRGVLLEGASWRVAMACDTEVDDENTGTGMLEDDIRWRHTTGATGTQLGVTRTDEQDAMLDNTGAVGCGWVSGTQLGVTRTDGQDAMLDDTGAVWCDRSGSNDRWDEFAVEDFVVGIESDDCAATVQPEVEDCWGEGVTGVGSSERWLNIENAA